MIEIIKQTKGHAEQSANNFQQFIFQEIAQFIELAECGVPHHPVAARDTGNQYSQVMLHHLSLMQFTKIVGHLTKEFSGIVGTGYNMWSQAPGCSRLGYLLKVSGAGTG